MSPLESLIVRSSRPRICGEPKAEALVGTWAYHVVRADTELAYAYAERQAELAEKTGGPIQQVAGLRARGLTAFFTGWRDVTAARKLLSEIDG